MADEDWGGGVWRAAGAVHRPPKVRHVGSGGGEGGRRGGQSWKQLCPVFDKVFFSRFWFFLVGRKNRFPVDIRI